MRLVAIITPKIHHNGYDDYNKIIESITDWSEVTEEEYKLLYSYCLNYDYEIIERQDVEPSFILKNIRKNLINEKKKTNVRRKLHYLKRKLKQKLKKRNYWNNLNQNIRNKHE